jgi:hypothetical protein
MSQKENVFKTKNNDKLQDTASNFLQFCLCVSSLNKILKKISHGFKAEASEVGGGIQSTVFYVCVYIYIYTHTHTYIYIYIYAYICMQGGNEMKSNLGNWKSRFVTASLVSQG